MALTDLGAQETARWDDLCAREPALRSPFLSRAYASAVDRARGGVEVVVLEDEDRGGFWPMQFGSRGARLIRVAEEVGGWMTDASGIVAGGTLRIDVDRLLAAGNLAGFRFTHLDEAQAIADPGSMERRMAPRIDVGAGFDPYWHAIAGRDRKFVADTDRRHRKLIQDVGALRFEFAVRAADQLETELARVIDVKRSQYRRTGARDALGPRWPRALLAILARSTAPQCQGVLSTLYAGSTWAASHFGLRHGSLLQHWFPVYNPALRQYAPGRLLLRRMLEAAGDEGVTVFDLGVGDYEAKRDFSNATHAYYRAICTRGTLAAEAWRLAFASRRRLGGALHTFRHRLARRP